jgi:OOP family OmpA-OmpF porin
MPFAAVAAVIRGEPPVEYRSTLGSVVRRISEEFGSELRVFAGDTEPFVEANVLLEDALQESIREGRRLSPRARVWLTWLERGAATAAVLGLVLAAVVGYRTYRREAERAAAAQAFVDALTARPGVVVVDTEREDQGVHVRALRDRLADVDGLSPPPGVEVDWEEFLSLDPAFVARRVARSLAPPPTVDVAVEGGTLLLSGAAPHRWIEGALSVAPTLGGVDRVDRTALRDLDVDGFAAAVAEIEEASLPFAADGLPPRLPPRGFREAFAERMLRLDRHAAALDLPFYVILRVVAPPDEVVHANQRLMRLSNRLAWSLQKRGLTTYRVLRCEVRPGATGDRFVHFKVARHGVAI